MNMPDRSADVRFFYANHPEYFTAERHDENRRRSLPAVIEYLEGHPADAGKWGVLVKTDRNNKIPCDVLVWRDTLEHVDIMDSQGGIWGPHGPIDVNAGGPGIWFWAPASVVDPTGEERALQGPPYDGGQDAHGEPQEPSPPPVDLTPILARLDAHAADLAALRGLLQQLLDRPAPPVVVPPIAFPVYAGDVRAGWLGTFKAELHPRVD